MGVVQTGESAAYRQARDTLLQAEIELRAKTAEVAALRRKLPPGAPVESGHDLTRADGVETTLDTLLPPDRNSLVVYSLMFGPNAKSPCPMCTSLLDGLDGQVPHITANAAFAVVAESPPDRLARLASDRGWRNLPLYSCGADYQAAYHARTPDGGQLPILNVFERDEAGKLRHFWGSETFFADLDGHPRHVDTIWPLWNLLDLTRQGRGDFLPRLTY